MELVQIATLLQDLGADPGRECGSVDDYTWQDVGTSVETMTTDMFKSFGEKFAMGVIKTFFETRQWSKRFDMLYDSQEYEGIKQYVKASLIEPTDATIINLVNGRDYTDGVYRDLKTNAKIYTKDLGYAFDWSVPNVDLRFMFSNAESVAGYEALINATVSNSINKNMWNVELSTICGVIVRCLNSASPKVVHLVTQYNTETGESLTSANCMKSVDFKRWFIEQIANLRSLITDWSDKYNNDGVESFTPPEDTRVTLLTQLHNALRNISTFEMIGTDLTLGKYNTVNAWQSATSKLLPTIADVSTIVDNSGDDPVTYSNIAGVIYDKYTCGYTLKCNKVTSGYVYKGDFTNFQATTIGQAFINEFNNAIVLALD